MDLSPKIFTGGGLDEKKSKKKKKKRGVSLFFRWALSLSLLWTPLCSPSTLSLFCYFLSLASSLSLSSKMDSSFFILSPSHLPLFIFGGVMK